MLSRRLVGVKVCRCRMACCLALFALVGAGACSGPSSSGPRAPEAPRPAAPTAASPQPLSPPPPAPGVGRQQLVHLLGASPGAFFAHVEIEAAFDGGRFVGWRLADLPGQRPRWLDLRTGDVVTAINGLGVERPDDALRIWETLQVASEVHIEYRRQGEARSVRIPVHDQGPTEVESEPSPAGQSKN